MAFSLYHVPIDCCQNIETMPKCQDKKTFFEGHDWEFLLSLDNYRKCPVCILWQQSGFSMHHFWTITKPFVKTNSYVWMSVGWTSACIKHTHPVGHYKIVIALKL